MIKKIEALATGRWIKLSRVEYLEACQWLDDPENVEIYKEFDVWCDNVELSILINKKEVKK